MLQFHLHIMNLSSSLVCLFKGNMDEYEQALYDLYMALRYSTWNDNKPYLYEINGTAKVIADAVIALVEKRRSKGIDV